MTTPDDELRELYASLGFEVRVESLAAEDLETLDACKECVLVACTSPIRTQHDSDPGADFAKYRSFAWISEEPLMGLTDGPYLGVDLSPDGSRLAVEILQDENDVWIYDLERGTLNPRTGQPWTFGLVQGILRTADKRSRLLGPD